MFTFGDMKHMYYEYNNKLVWYVDGKPFSANPADYWDIPSDDTKLEGDLMVRVSEEYMFVGPKSWQTR